MRCQRQPVIVWTGVTVSITTKSRKDDVPRTSAVDAETCATEFGRPWMSEMISGAMNTKGRISSPRKNHTPSTGSTVLLRLRAPVRDLPASGWTGAMAGATVGLLPMDEAAVSRLSRGVVSQRVTCMEMVPDDPGADGCTPNGGCGSEGTERYH